jgi:CBS domain-containing protein
MIHPTPALTVRADTPIAQCLELMQKHEVGSLIVVSDDQRQEPIGIFTERDLLKRVTQLRIGSFWNRPIRTVMSRPLRTLPLSQLGQAGDVMLRHNIRHLPVVVPGPDGTKRLIGMISMRDILRWYIPFETPKTPEAPKRMGPGLAVAVYTRDRTLANGVRKLLLAPSLSRRALIRIQPELPDAGYSPAVGREPVVHVVDLESFAPAEWASFLRERAKRRDEGKVAVLYDPKLHAPRMIQALLKLKATPPFSLFPKPFDLSAFEGFFGKKGT